MIKLSGKIFLKCFANVVLPEHVAPLRPTNVKFVVIMQRADVKGRKGAYPSPTRMTRVRSASAAWAGVRAPCLGSGMGVDVIVVYFDVQFTMGRC